MVEASFCYRRCSDIRIGNLKQDRVFEITMVTTFCKIQTKLLRSYFSNSSLGMLALRCKNAMFVLDFKNIQIQ
jgi:hypothetical protein